MKYSRAEGACENFRPLFAKFKWIAYAVPNGAADKIFFKLPIYFKKLSILLKIVFKYRGLRQEQNKLKLALYLGPFYIL